MSDSPVPGPDTSPPPPGPSVVEETTIAPHQVEHVSQGTHTAAVSTEKASADNVVEQGGDVEARSIPKTPQVAITFLLVSARRRTMNFEPDTAIGRVKELLWNTWPADWNDERPPAPSYLRILWMGKMLQDDETLISLKFPTHMPLPGHAPPTNPPPTIVHLSIRVHPPNTTDNGKKKKRGSILQLGNAAGNTPESAQEGSPRSGCCCVIC